MHKVGGDWAENHKSLLVGGAPLARHGIERNRDFQIMSPEAASSSKDWSIRLVEGKDGIIKVMSRESIQREISVAAFQHVSQDTRRYNHCTRFAPVSLPRHIHIRSYGNFACD